MISNIEAKKKIKVYKREMVKYEKRIIITSIIMLIISLGLILLFVLNNWNIKSLYDKSSTSLPLLIYLSFCLKEYKINRKYYNFYNYYSTLNPTPENLMIKFLKK